MTDRHAVIHPVSTGPLCCHACGAPYDIERAVDREREGNRLGHAPRIYQKRLCRDCLKPFIPTGPTGRYCPACQALRR
jgi:hypothetical protein